MNIYKLKSYFSIKFILGKIIILLLPFVLVLFIGRFAFSNKFLKWEYKRSSFPTEHYGFSTADRLKYGPKFLDYLYTNKDISYLEDLTFSNGKKLLIERELNHMKDVKKVIEIINNLRLVLCILFAVCILFLIFNSNLKFIFNNIFKGSILTIFCLISISIIGFFSFNTFFNYFHRLIGFSKGTWIFYESDTLIRLFPLKLWYDGFIILLSSLLGISSILAIISWVFSKVKII